MNIYMGANYTPSSQFREDSTKNEVHSISMLGESGSASKVGVLACLLGCVGILFQKLADGVSQVPQ